MLKRISMMLLLTAALCAPALAKVAEISYLKNGVYSGKVATYSLNGAVYLDAAQAALVGILNRDQMSAAFAPVKKAAWACAVLTHSHFVYKFHGDDPALRLSDLQVIKAFSGT